MKRISVLFPAIIISLIHLSCVTTGDNSVEEINPPVEKESSGPEKTDSGEDAVSSGSESTSDKSGIIYSSRSLADGPLILGSTEYMTGPIMEYSLLYTIYFPLSGIEPPLSHYEPGTGTRWQVESDELDGTVYFERALLSVDNEMKSWWFFKVEGDGFERIYEFLIDSEWTLLEMRYRDRDMSVSTYVPSVDEEKDLLGKPLDLDDMPFETVRMDTSEGERNIEHYTSETAEYWLDESVPGTLVRSLLKRDGEVLLQADLIEIKEDYETVLGSY